jgi:hypothetical protein
MPLQASNSGGPPAEAESGQGDCRASLSQAVSVIPGGPVIANGRVYVNSGYGRFLGHGGNVLLALSVDGK